MKEGSGIELGQDSPCGPGSAPPPPTHTQQWEAQFPQNVFLEPLRMIRTRLLLGRAHVCTHVTKITALRSHGSPSPRTTVIRQRRLQRSYVSGGSPGAIANSWRSRPSPEVRSQVSPAPCYLGSFTVQRTAGVLGKLP